MRTFGKYSVNFSLLIIMIIMTFSLSLFSNLIPLATVVELQEKGHLPCVEQLRKAVNENSKLDLGLKTMILSHVESLTFEKRNQWISTLNPVILDKARLLQIEWPCVTAKIAVALITNGFSGNLQEWLLYYKLIGVENIIFFDDSVRKSLQQELLLEAIKPFIDIGFVIYHQTPKTSNSTFDQAFAYNYTLAQYQDTYDWIGFLDSDEFVVTHKEKCLSSFLDAYSDYGGLAMEWRLVGPLGVVTHNPHISCFNQYSFGLTDPERHVKIFIRPQYVERMHVHNAVMKERVTVNSQFQTVPGHTNRAMDKALAYSDIEVRHFIMGDVNFMFFEKVCGLGVERKQYIDTRISMALRSLQEDTDEIKELPLILPDLNAALFGH
jgi:hypothetical protein